MHLGLLTQTLQLVRYNHNQTSPGLRYTCCVNFEWTHGAVVSPVTVIGQHLLTSFIQTDMSWRKYRQHPSPPILTTRLRYSLRRACFILYGNATVIRKYSQFQTALSSSSRDMRVQLTIEVFILFLAVRQTHATDSSSAHDTSQEKSLNIQKRRLSLQNTGRQ